MSLHPLALLLLATTSNAVPSFEVDLARIKTRESSIDAALQNLSRQSGVPLSSQWSTPTADSTQKPTSLIRTYGDLTELRMATGKALAGHLRNRLIVGPEGSPAILEINSDQGSQSGLKLLGKARQSSTQGRVLIEFDRMTFRGGKTLPIRASALDIMGAYGLEAKVFSSKALMLAGAIAGSFISGFAAAQQTQTTTAIGFQQTQPSMRNGILQGVAQTTADQSKRMIDEATAEKPVLVVEAGESVVAFFDEEVRY
jgi:hypothetical protein